MGPEVSVNGTNVLTSVNNTSVINMSVNGTNVNGTNVSKPKKKYNTIMSELLKPPPKEEKPNIHLSGGGQFSKLDKI